MKWFFTALLVLTLLFAVTNCVTTTIAPKSDFKYKNTGDTVEITDYTGEGVIKKPPLTPWEPLGEFNVALAPGGDGKTHFIQTKIVPAYDSNNKKILTELNRRRFELRDIVTGVLAKKRFSDLVGSDGKDRLIKDLMAKFNNVLIHGQIKALYMPKYIVQ